MSCASFVWVQYIRLPCDQTEYDALALCQGRRTRVLVPRAVRANPAVQNSCGHQCSQEYNAGLRRGLWVHASCVCRHKRRHSTRDIWHVRQVLVDCFFQCQNKSSLHVVRNRVQCRHCRRVRLQLIAMRFQRTSSPRQIIRHSERVFEHSHFRVLLGIPHLET